MGELVTLGEVMAVTRVSGIGIPSPGAPATLSYAGAEATVAIGMSRLGHRATWLGRLGRDAAADMILTSMRGEGVDVSHTVRDDDRPTGQMTRYRRTADRVVVVYHRRDGAGVRLSPGDVAAEAIASADVLHLTGITPALGPGPAAAVERALEVAEQAGVPVSFDVNYRASLWPPEQAGEVLRRLAGRAEVVFAGLEEARLVVNGAPAARADGDDPVALARPLLDLGPREVVIKLGREGAYATDGNTALRMPARKVSEVDPVGAGDAFVAGYLSGRLDGLDPAGRLERAVTCGAFAVSTWGDWEGLPRRRELDLLAAGDDVTR
ncbi:sugar kinase [Thermostaphylospora chromogena]|uniref:2-dehydro-3-deoxygluconokinase n=1 Tax=Thermostaphylospora chromogena TaxID=35622 RepID=A0A1H1HC84_9ACTN|nr:sugar kinase [Thermostaphylospora chromogena]SDR22993.1 2-dehydro-3-deoxygluconokinase [Thermostaphylospora chromogena]